MLRKLSITNFRSCHSTEIEFDQSVCALTGKNGAGKTNILACLQWFASSAAAPEPVDARPAGHGTAGEPRRISVTIVLDINDTNYEYSISVPYVSRIRGGLIVGPKGLVGLRDETINSDRGAGVFRSSS